ncbi:hypothetical protein GCM10023083_08630 [Streptomyces phyllanthi]
MSTLRPSEPTRGLGVIQRRAPVPVERAQPLDVPGERGIATLRMNARRGAGVASLPDSPKILEPCAASRASRCFTAAGGAALSGAVGRKP